MIEPEISLCHRSYILSAFQYDRISSQSWLRKKFPRTISYHYNRSDSLQVELEGQVLVIDVIDVTRCSKKGFIKVDKSVKQCKTSSNYKIVTCT